MKVTDLHRQEASSMSEQIDYEHRSFFGTAAMSIAAAQVGMMGSARAQTGNAKPKQLPTIKPGTNTSFGSRITAM